MNFICISYTEPKRDTSFFFPWVNLPRKKIQKMKMEMEEEKVKRFKIQTCYSPHNVQPWQPTRSLCACMVLLKFNMRRMKRYVNSSETNRESAPKCINTMAKATSSVWIIFCFLRDNVVILLFVSWKTRNKLTYSVYVLSSVNIEH